MNYVNVTGFQSLRFGYHSSTRVLAKEVIQQQPKLAVPETL